MTTQGIQKWTVPATGTYSFTVAGARGGNVWTINGGRGRVISQTDVSLSAGTILHLVVGQHGGNSTNGLYGDSLAAGGGGGSFVYVNSIATNNCILAAGGGGGAAWNSGVASRDGQTSTSGSSGTTGTNGSYGGGAGGSGGSGGGAGAGAGAGTSGTNISGGNGGIDNGTGGSGGGGGMGVGGVGATFLGGTAPGTTLGSSSKPGGFGGGGGCTIAEYGGRGGGGGYSGGGGGGGAAQGVGGGGGSYSAYSTGYNNNAGTNNGDGYITISKASQSSMKIYIFAEDTTTPVNTLKSDIETVATALGQQVTIITGAAQGSAATALDYDSTVDVVLYWNYYQSPTGRGTQLQTYLDNGKGVVMMVYAHTNWSNPTNVGLSTTYQITTSGSYTSESNSYSQTNPTGHPILNGVSSILANNYNLSFTSVNAATRIGNGPGGGLVIYKDYTSTRRVDLNIFPASDTTTTSNTRLTYNACLWAAKKDQVSLTNYTNITATSAKAFSYIAMPGGSRTLLNYIQSFGVVGSSTNNGAGSWLTSYSGDIAYTASPITTIAYFTTYNRVRVIDGDGTSDGLDWSVFNFGIANGGGDFDGTASSNSYFGGENTASGGTGGQSVTTGYIWGYSSSGWVLLYQLTLGSGVSTYNHTNGSWFASGGTVTSGNGKRTEYDSLTITHLGFSVT
jgi:hypothetical protein